MRARPFRRNGCTAQAALLVPERSFSDRHGAEPGRPGRLAWRKPRGPSALDRRDARRTPVPARALAFKGDETERELRTIRGATPGPRMNASTWTVEGVPPARRSASSARRRGVSSALTSRGQALTAGRKDPPRATQRPRHELPPSSTGQPVGDDPIRPRPQRRSERIERESGDRGAHDDRAQPREMTWRSSRIRASIPGSSTRPNPRGRRRANPAGRRGRQTEPESPTGVQGKPRTSADHDTGDGGDGPGLAGASRRRPHEPLAGR